MGRVNPHGGVGGDDEGPDVEGGAALAGHPVALQAHQGLDALQGGLLRELGDAHALAGLIHPADVVHGPEELHAALGAAVGLHTLKDLLGVVEDHGGGLKAQGGVGHDAAVMPALSGLVIHQEHMVGEGLAEDQGFGVGLGLERLGPGDGEFLHGDSLLFYFKFLF